MRFKKEYYLIALVLGLVITGCKKIDSGNLNNPANGTTLAQVIAANSDLSVFNGFIIKTGVDVTLSSSKSFTVWAPNNAALASLDPAIVNDVTKLRSFVLNHISYQAYFLRDVPKITRIGMLNGKYNNFFGTKFEDANVVTADKETGNGVLHIIDKSIPVLPNLWEFIVSTAAQYLQNNFVSGLNFSTFDPSLATVDSISKLTGLPVYHPGTGIVIKNYFNERVVDTRREEKQFTYFVLANSAFTQKADELKPYFKSSSTTITDSLDKWNIVKDLLFDTLYPTAASLPSVLTSRYGVQVPINKATIIDTKKVSNGIVYVLSQSDVPVANKFLPFTIEGEKPTGFLSDKTSNTAFQRIRQNPVTGLFYTDLLVSGHGTTGYYSFYRLNDMPSMKYNVYGLAVNDFTTTAVYQNIVPVQYVPPPFTVNPSSNGYIYINNVAYPAGTFTGLPAVSTQFPANTTQLGWAVPLSTVAGAYNEVFLGSFTVTQFGIIDLRLTSAAGVTGTPPAIQAGSAQIVLDYLRIVPVP